MLGGVVWSSTPTLQQPWCRHRGYPEGAQGQIEPSASSVSFLSDSTRFHKRNLFGLLSPSEALIHMEHSFLSSAFRLAARARIALRGIRPAWRSYRAAKLRLPSLDSSSPRDLLDPLRGRRLRKKQKRAAGGRAAGQGGRRRARAGRHPWQHGIKRASCPTCRGRGRRGAAGAASGGTAGQRSAFFGRRRRATSVFEVRRSFVCSFVFINEKTLACEADLTTQPLCLLR